MIPQPHRRHLTREQRQELVLRLRQQGWSTTRIAKQLNVSDETVRIDIRAAASKFLEPPTVLGRDGKQYPAARPARSVFVPDSTMDVAPAGTGTGAAAQEAPVEAAGTGAKAKLPHVATGERGKRR
jgi:hypothetical protein